MTVSTTDSSDLLHSLGYIYLRMGQQKRALVLLLLANRVAPDDTGILRTLTSALLETGSAQRALLALNRLAELEPDGAPALILLRVRALWLMDRKVEAREKFQAYIASRRKE